MLCLFKVLTYNGLKPGDNFRGETLSVEAILVASSDEAVFVLTVNGANDDGFESISGLNLTSSTVNSSLIGESSFSSFGPRRNLYCPRHIFVCFFTHRRAHAVLASR